MPSRRTKRILLGVLLILGCIGAGIGIYSGVCTVQPVIIKAFQDPRVFNNGTAVTTIAEWAERRAEIKEIVLSNEYGHMPGRPDAINVTRLASEAIATLGTMETLDIGIIPSNATPDAVINFTAWLFIPLGAGPFPAVVKVGRERGGSETMINHTMLERGYLYACYNHTQLDPDTEGYDIVGACQSAYPSYDWGSVAVWAWGTMRLVDYLVAEPWVSAPEGFPKIDPTKIIVTGHSRRGKTALLAGAMDERINVTAPNGSGCGGAGSFLVQGCWCETIALITMDATYKSWFHKDFGRYGWREGDLPFDQHFLRALIAPRFIISTDGLGDLWANPMGTQAVYQAAQPIFNFLGAPTNNAIHFREGEHGFLAGDFDVILDFADKMLLNQTVDGEFYMTPFTFQASIPYS